jgi:hypothetical protein
MLCQIMLPSTPKPYPLLWEGHMSDPCQDQVHTHSCTSLMAIWQSTLGVHTVLALGARSVVSGFCGLCVQLHPL